MAVVKYKIKRIQELIGKERPAEEIKEAIENIGEECEIDEENEEIKINVNPNRPDLYTIEGIARAVLNFLEIKEPRPYKIDNAKYELVVGNVSVRPYIVAGIAYNVNINEDFLKDLIQAQETIHENFGRKRKKIAIGLHDFDKTKPPYYYKEMKYTRFIPLDMNEELAPHEILKKHPKGIQYGEIYKNVDNYPLVFDSQGVISFPPIINCERTRINENTKNIFIEITGTSIHEMRSALNIILCSLYDNGARIENVKLKYVDREENSTNFERIEKLEYKFLNKTLGIRLRRDEIERCLKRMGSIPKSFDEKSVSILVPPYRADIIHQIDFVEDIAIAYGYENFKPKIPNFNTIGSLTKESEIEEKIKLDLVSLGFYEVISFTLSNEEKEEMCEIKNEKIKIENAISKEISIFRSSIFPSLMQVLSINKTKSFPQKIFEIGKVGIKEEKCTKNAICALISNTKVSFSEIKGVYQVINEHLGTSYKAMDFDFTIPGRAIGIFKKEKLVGWCGEINPKVIRNFKLENPVAGFEIILD
jgi:phenylalanyl-tRNA synthetase beta chain